MRTYKLLLVDDEAEFRAATSRALSRRGFEVRTAADGTQALARIDDEVPDVVVLDLRMPELDGIGTLAALRDSGCDVPVVILTGHGALDDALAGVRLGIVDFLAKPIDVDALAARLRDLLERGRAPLLSERTVAELMVPALAYRRVYEDEPVAAVIGELLEALAAPASSELHAPGQRAVLVFDRADHFAGFVRIEDVLRALVPRPMLGSPYASFLTGMFLAQCKLLGRERAGDLIEDELRIACDAPLLEAVHVLVTERVTSLPVVGAGQVVGVLRDRDVFLEVARTATLA